jgi:hypothetical protein
MQRSSSIRRRTPALEGDYWILTNIYAPCTPDGKKDFCEWFKDIQMPDDQEWLIVGDFNLM